MSDADDLLMRLGALKCQRCYKRPGKYQIDLTSWYRKSKLFCEPCTLKLQKLILGIPYVQKT